MTRLERLAMFVAAAPLLPCIASAQTLTQGLPTPAPTLAHELALVAIGAVMGAVLGPIGYAIAVAVGPERGRRAEQTRVHSDIAAALHDLSDAVQGLGLSEATSQADAARVVTPLHTEPNDRHQRG